MSLRIPLPNAPAGSVIEGAGQINALKESELNNTMKGLQNKYYAPNILSEIANKNAMTQGQQITNKYLPEQLRLANALSGMNLKYFVPKTEAEINLQKSQAGLAGSEAQKNAYLLQHPGLLGGEESKTIQSLKDMGYLNKTQGNQINVSGAPNGQATTPSSSPLSMGNQLSSYAPFDTGDAMVNAILNKPYSNMAYRQKMTQGFNWVHLPVDTKNQLIAQGYGMGVEPLKMMDYVNNGMSLKQIAEKEGLDPENLPPPIYAPTTATKTRVQQVEQVGRELDYLSSASTPLIKQYANTFAGFSPERISDMLSGNEEAQKRFGRYIGALSIQTGLSTGRALLEGTNRPGVEIMREIKNSSLKGIDQHSPIKMSKVAYQAAQDTIDEILQKGAKIRTVTGMNPMSEIGSRNKNNESNVQKWGRDANGKAVRIG